MVFVWSYLTDGDPAYTLVQVCINDLIMLFLFAPIVRLLVHGASSLEVLFIGLFYSVLIFGFQAESMTGTSMGTPTTVDLRRQAGQPR